MNDNRMKYIIACVQLNTILNIMPKEIRCKIPEEYLREIEKHKLKGYVFKYDYNKSLEEQQISDLTREILADIYKEYICDSQEKAEFETKITMLVDELKKMQK